MSAQPSTVSVLGSRLGRHTAIYGLGNGIGLLLSVVAVLSTTAYLEPAQFGILGICLVFSSGLTVLYNLGSLQGSFRLAFGAAGTDDDDGGGGDDDDAYDLKPGRDRRKSLGTALVLTTLIGLVGTALLWPLTPVLHSALFDKEGSAGLIHLSLALGAVGALWRMTINIPRLERRPWAFVGFSSLRPLVVIALILPILSSGAGVRGALLANLIGNAVVLSLALFASRRSFRPAFLIADVKRIALYGRRWVPLVTAIWVSNNADVLMLNHFTASGDVGFYRLASRVCVVLSFASSAIFMAWLPVRRSVLFQAAQAEHGDRLNALLAQYYVVLMAGLLLALAVFADVIVGVAPADYAPAAELVPWLGLAVAVHGIFYLAYRVSRHRRRRRDYAFSAVGAAIMLIALAAFLIPAFGAVGAALAPTIGFGLAAVFLLVRSQRGPKPVPFDVARTVLPAAVAGALYAVERALPVDGRPVGVAIAVVTVVAYPVALAATGIVPRDQARILWESARAALPQPGEPGRLRQRIASLDAATRTVLAQAVVPRTDLGALARRVGQSEVDTARELIAALRVAGDLPAAESHYDERVARHLLVQRSVADRDAEANVLIADGVAPRDLDDLSTVLAAVRRHRRRVFDARDRPASLTPAPNAPAG